LTRTSFIKRKVYPKEGTRVRIPGVYHITTWYGAVGHWGVWEWPGSVFFSLPPRGRPFYGRFGSACLSSLDSRVP
jgi:hypothetical protein